jgi:murein L,D-transpeptidase YcbB/YkuD
MEKMNLSQFFSKILFFSTILVFFACNEEHKHIGEPQIVNNTQEINTKAEDIIHQSLKDILSKQHILDSFQITNPDIVNSLYEGADYKLLWSSEGRFRPEADSLFSFIEHSRLFGLFPSDYYETRIRQLQADLRADTSHVKLDASKWALNDLLYTTAFVQIVKDLKIGRILPDSIVRQDSTLNPGFFHAELERFRTAGDKNSFAITLEPKNPDYHRLKASLPSFLDTAQFRKYTFVQAYDSTRLRQLVYQRLIEEDSLQVRDVNPDSAALADAIRRYQEKTKIKVDGKLSNALINRLNDTEHERFIRVAITMDRFKLLQSMPAQYIWVNIPTYHLQVREQDSVVLTSKVVVGKVYTRTPEITSAISDMITYPQWTIPESIIAKEILPGLKRDPGYTTKRGYSILDKDGNVIDPYFVDWSQFKKGIPYKVIQGSGDANALGVLKFNFPNKHAVYLHDTNQRYLFAKKDRALSHGCVRVESWKRLAEYILRSDSLATPNAVPADSLRAWLALKEKHVIPVRKRVPLFIRYFTCEGADGRLVFHEDIYGEDRKLRDKYFARK